MTKIKVSELTGPLLDLYVAKADPRCEGLEFDYVAEEGNEHYIAKVDVENGNQEVCVFIPTRGWHQATKLSLRYKYAQEYSPSTDWKLGGPIIDREGIDPDPMIGDDGKPEYWCCFLGDVDGNGHTLLIAAMRCYVASKFGEEVEC